MPRYHPFKASATRAAHYVASKFIRKNTKRKVGYASTSRRKIGKPAGYARTTRRQNIGKVTKLAKQVRKLTEHDKASLGTMTYRLYDSGSVHAGVSDQGVLSFPPLSTGRIELVLGQLKFFNPAIPGTLTTASQASGGFQRNVRFDAVTSTMTLRNSYQVGCTARVYMCCAKDDTNSTAMAAWSSGVTDSTNLAAITDVGSYPTDSNLVKDLYSVKVIKTVHLMPGNATTFSHTAKPFEYDSSTVDTHNMSYQREYGRAFQFLVVITGDVGHDSVVAGEQTSLQCGLDFSAKFTYKVVYNAGINISYVYVEDNRNATFTNDGVEGLKTTDNQAYSVS